MGVSYRTPHIYLGCVMIHQFRLFPSEDFLHLWRAYIHKVEALCRMEIFLTTGS